MSEFSDSDFPGDQPKLPDDLPKLPSGRPATRKQSNLGTWLGLLSVCLCSGLFMLLTALVMPSALGVVVVVFFAAIFFLLHYMTWGRWLMNRRRIEDDE